MELSEEHTHDDDVVEIHIPGWVLWTAGGILAGLLAVIAWDVYTQKRKARELAAKLVTVGPLDFAAVEKWANKQVEPTVVQDEQPESPPL